MDLIDIHSPKPYAQLDFKYRVGKTVVFAMVEHRKNDAGTAALLSIDGYWEQAKWFPISKLTIHRSTVEPRFMVVQMPGALANEKELPAQNARPRLTPMIAWSGEAKAEWERVTSHRIRINDAVQLKSRGYRKEYHRQRFGETA
jgi:hypothetical protein